MSRDTVVEASTTGPFRSPRPRATDQVLATALAAIDQRFAGRYSTGADLRRQHANTLTFGDNEPPDVVVFAECNEDVVELVSIARSFSIPIVPFGAGTSLEGHLNAPSGGISLDLSRMDQILAVNEADLDCSVQAGISRRRLNESLRDTGLYFSVDPGAGEATLGGMAATRASGTSAVRYGTMRDNVLNVTAVMADGSIVKTGGRARKSAAGYDLTRLLVGSEGTLGIITELTVKLNGRPETMLAAVAPFKSIAGACDATMTAIQLGLGVARIELLDAVQIAAVNMHSRLALDEAPTLFLEFHGTPAAAREQVEIFGGIARENGAIRFDWAESEDDRRRLWQARHDALWAVKTRWPGREVVVTDVCVPISRLAECVAETEADIAAAGLVAPIVGHVGDGNFHCIVLVDREDPAARRRLEAFTDRLAARAIAMDGTCTGEHGVGQGKMRFLENELGEGIEVMRRIKKALDPDDILNPGKMFRI